ncbi:lactoylglutathione lyase family protein [Thalassovita sp.]|uniref:lactoylglutathione lyase family protein n=1 Tax=Thalassovita sp. TaxID=1979401 RepID=UPI002AB0B844|nr:lactoylglutathione lyase family protein [Thalassovita sp.]
MSATVPRTFSHIGLSVPDLDAAVQFYRDILGFYVIMEPTEVTQDDSAIGVMCNDVFVPGWGRFRIAHLATGDRVGIELFEFPDNYLPEDKLPFRQVGLFHFAIQDPDPEALLERIIAAGGKARMPIRRYYPGEKPYRMVYVEDPFGIVFELYSHGYELTYSAGAYA